MKWVQTDRKATCNSLHLHKNSLYLHIDVYSATYKKKHIHNTEQKKYREKSKKKKDEKKYEQRIACPYQRLGHFDVKLNRHRYRYVHMHILIYIFVGRRNNISRFIVTSDKICWVCDDLFNKNETFNSIPFATKTMQKYTFIYVYIYWSIHGAYMDSTISLVVCVIFLFGCFSQWKISPR